MLQIVLVFPDFSPHCPPGSAEYTSQAPRVDMKCSYGPLKPSRPRIDIPRAVGPAIAGRLVGRISRQKNN